MSRSVSWRMRTRRTGDRDGVVNEILLCISSVHDICDVIVFVFGFQITREENYSHNGIN